MFVSWGFNQQWFDLLQGEMMWFTIDDTIVGVVSVCLIIRIYVNYIAI